MSSSLGDKIPEVKGMWVTSETDSGMTESNRQSMGIFESRSARFRAAIASHLAGMMLRVNGVVDI